MRGVVSLAAAFALPIVLTTDSRFPGALHPVSHFLRHPHYACFPGAHATGLDSATGVVDDGLTDEEERQARLEANRSRDRFHRRNARSDSLSARNLRSAAGRILERLEQLEACTKMTGNPSGEVLTPNYQRLQQSALNVERQTIIRLRNQNAINDEALRRIQRDLDLAEARLSGA